VEVALTNKTVDANGSIDLTISGGTPNYNFNWSDLSGNTQPEDRIDLEGGTYSVTVTDANGCSVVVENLFIADFEACQAVAGTAVATNSSTICLDNGEVNLTVAVDEANVPVGFEQAYILTSGADDAIIRISTNRSIKMIEAGEFAIHSLVYDPATINLNNFNNNNSTIANINVLLLQGGGMICGALQTVGTAVILEDCPFDPVANTRFQDVAVTDTDTFCLDLAGFDETGLVVSLVDGSNTGTSEFGTYSIVGTCIVYTAGTDPGTFVDSITVVATNTNNDTLTTVFIISIFNEDCENTMESMTINVGDCADAAPICLPIPLEDYQSYSIFSNGQPYAGSLEACNFDTVIAYTYFTLIGMGESGPYRLDSWPVNDNSFTGDFANVNALADSMNTWDPTGNWTILPNQLLIVGGNPANDYGIMKVTQLGFLNSEAEIGFNIGLVALGSEISLPVGEYEVKLVNDSTTCIHTINLTVECNMDAIPTPTNDTLNLLVQANQTNQVCVELEAGFDRLTTTFELYNGNTTDGSAFGNWTITDNGCLEYTAGTTEGINVDTICVAAISAEGIRDTTCVIVSITPREPTTETVPFFVEVLDSVTVCGNIPTDFGTDLSIMLQDGGTGNASTFGNYMVNVINGCISYAANAIPGESADTIMVVVCDNQLNLCHTINYIATITEGDEEVATTTDTLILSVVANNSEAINIPLEDGFDANTTTITLENGGSMSGSGFGAWELSEDNDLVYNAGNNTGIGIDTILVIATNADGLQDTTIVIVNITAQPIVQDTIFFDLRASSMGVFCPVLPDTFGMNLSSNLMFGGNASTSAYADYSVNDTTGCITYSAKELTGAFVDTVEVVTCDVDLDICVRTFFIATINPSLDTIQVNTNEGRPVEICIPTDQLFTPFDSLELCNDPLFGTVELNAEDTCITYTPNPGLMIGGMDTICIVTKDDTGVTDSTYVIIEVVPPCTELFEDEVQDLVITDCEEGLKYCVEVPLNAINNYDFFLNGEMYDNGFEACNIDSAFAYTYFTVPDRGAVGPYTLNNWTINGEDFSTGFEDISTLVDSMNVWDTIGTWTLNEDLLIIEGGMPGVAYGMLDITQDATGAMATLLINDNITPRGTVLSLPIGTNQLVITERNLGCTDTITVNVSCRACIEVYSGPTTLFLDNCDTTATVCLDIDLESGAVFSITDNGQPAAVTVCEGDSLTAYDIELIPGNGVEGPYELNGWDVNDSTFIGTTFNNPLELVNQLNNFDPTGNWFVDTEANLIKGGNRNMRYENMRITQTNTENRAILQVQFVGGIDNLGLSLSTGIHSIFITNLEDGCEYSYDLTIDCKIDVPENGTVIDTTIFRDDTQTICIDTDDLPGAPVSITNVCESAATGMIDYSIDTENFCVTYTGISAGSDALCIEVCDADGNCDTTNIIIQVLPLSAKDTIEVSVVNGKTETFCLETIILPAELDTIYNFCENESGVFVDVSVLEGTPCIEYTGIALGQDEACIVICDVEGNCDTTIFLINVTIPPTDTVEREVILNSDTLAVYCFDLGDLSGDIISFENYCSSDSAEIVQFTLDTTTFCVDINPLAVGQDTACLVACDEFGVCDTTILAVTVMPDADAILPIAIDDDTLTRLNTPVIINVLANDTINGDLVEVGIIELPENGTTFVNPDNSVTYAPDNDFCAIERDSFTYFISNEGGRDTATVSIQVLCEDITIFNGFSPNGDGVNDVFTILGIETFPDNEVTIFNRWGNEVFNRKGYTNAQGWDGTWNGNLVPDGTYFYVIDKGDGSDPVSGYVFLQR